MTKEVFEEKFLELVNRIIESVIKDAQEFLGSGIIDIELEDYPNDVYLLPKCVLVAMLEQQARQLDSWNPSSKM